MEAKTVLIDSVKKVFNSPTRIEWSKRLHYNPTLQARIDIISASGPYPSDPQARERLQRLRAQRAAWEAYFDAAIACGMFSGEEADSLTRNLRGVDEANFRAAMAECMSCWFLAGNLGLDVTPSPAGRNKRVLDFSVNTPDEEVFAEVKAPYRERPEDGWWGDDTDVLARCLKDANKQFEEGRKNLLILTPTLKWPVFSARDQLTKALFGHWVLKVPIDVKAPDATKNLRHKFIQDGELIARSRKDGRPLKPDGRPAHTRISAVLCIEERYLESVPHPADWLMQKAMSKPKDGGLTANEQREYEALEARHQGPLNQGWITHDALFIQNPNASTPITDEVWEALPHLVELDGRFHWSDQIGPDGRPRG